jgi:uncharacterized protein YyaL (SSP411 family)
MITEHVFEKFNDSATYFFFYTNNNQSDVIVRKKEVYDGAQPSGNAIMADNLYRLGLYFDVSLWKEKSVQMVSSLINAIVRYPTSFGAWACILLEISTGVNEIVVISEESQRILTQVLKEYIPHKIIMSATDGSNSFPLLSGKEKNKEAFLYLCRDYTCENPVSSINALIDLIRRKELKIS